MTTTIDQAETQAANDLREFNIYLSHGDQYVDRNIVILDIRYSVADVIKLIREAHPINTDIRWRCKRQGEIRHKIKGERKSRLVAVYTTTDEHEEMLTIDYFTDADDNEIDDEGIEIER